jgi:hypothetical protein
VEWFDEFVRVRGDDRERFQWFLGRGVSPSIPQSSEGVWRTVLHADRKWLLCLRIELLPLVERIRRHEAPTGFECLAKGRSGGDRLGLRIDRRQANLRLLGPEGILLANS